MLRLILLFLLIPAVCFTACNQNPAIIQVSSEEFHHIISEQEGVLLDVRTEREFQSGHIENAGQLNFYARDFRQRLLLLPRDKPVYIYCNTGRRSHIAASYLIRNGYSRVYNLKQGIMEWEQAGLPVAVDPNAIPDTDNRVTGSEFAERIQTDSLVFANFYAPWCGPCRQMMPMTDSLKTHFHGRIDVVKINADASKDLMREMKMVTVPWLVLYHKGEIIIEHKGLINGQELFSTLEHHYSLWKEGKYSSP
jgi:thioredoxin 1